MNQLVSHLGTISKHLERNNELQQNLNDSVYHLIETVVQRALDLERTIKKTQTAENSAPPTRTVAEVEESDAPRTDPRRLSSQLGGHSPSHRTPPTAGWKELGIGKRRPGGK